MQHKEEAKTEMRSKISEGLFLSVNSVISERSNFYAKNPDKRPAQHSVSSIVDKYKYLNASIVGTLNLIPGPLGMLVVVPELLAVMRNQLAMIYDIGTAYGHEKKITAEMLIGIFASVTMGGGLGLFVMQGQKVLVKRTSLRILQKIIAKLAGQITQRALKQMLAKWLPGVGAAVMATWAGYTTKKIGEKAIEIFSKDIELSTDTLEDEDDQAPPTATDTPPASAHPQSEDTVRQAEQAAKQAQRKNYALCLINLMNADGHKHERELEFIELIIQRLNFSASERESIRSLTHQTAAYPIQYEHLQDQETAFQLLLDMVSLAQRDGEFHAKERQYIMKVGQRIGYQEDSLKDMMETKE